VNHHGKTVHKPDCIMSYNLHMCGTYFLFTTEVKSVLVQEDHSPSDRHCIEQLSVLAVPETWLHASADVVPGPGNP